MSGFLERLLPALQRLPISGSSYDGDFFLAGPKCMLKGLPSGQNLSLPPYRRPVSKHYHTGVRALPFQSGKDTNMHHF